MCLSGFKCWKHIANVVFLRKPDLPRSVQPLAEVTLKTVILCFSYETYICARTEHDGGMPRLAEMTGTAMFFSETFTGTSLLEIRPSPCLESQSRTFAKSLLWEPERGRRHGETCAFTHPQRQHFTVIFMYSTHIQLRMSLCDCIDRQHCYLH